MIDSYLNGTRKNGADHDRGEAEKQEVEVFRNAVLRDHGSPLHWFPNGQGDPYHPEPIANRLNQVTNFLKRPMRGLLLRHLSVPFFLLLNDNRVLR